MAQYRVSTWCQTVLYSFLFCSVEYKKYPLSSWHHVLYSFQCSQINPRSSQDKSTFYSPLTSCLLETKYFFFLFFHEHLESGKHVMLMVCGTISLVAWRAKISWLKLDFYFLFCFVSSFIVTPFDSWTSSELSQCYWDSSIVSFDTVSLNMQPDSVVILAGVSLLIAQYLPARLYWAFCLDTFSCSENSRCKDKNAEVLLK